MTLTDFADIIAYDDIRYIDHEPLIYGMLISLICAIILIMVNKSKYFDREDIPVTPYKILFTIMMIVMVAAPLIGLTIADKDTGRNSYDIILKPDVDIDEVSEYFIINGQNGYIYSIEDPIN